MKLSWKPVILMPKTCLLLPLGGDEDPREWAERKCAELLGPEAKEEIKSKFTRKVAEQITLHRKEKQILSGLVFYPNFKRLPPVAAIDVDGYCPAPGKPPADLQSWREKWKPQRNTIGDMEITEVSLPSGPALRLHEIHKEKMLLGGHWISQKIMYAVRPPEIRDSVTLMVTWEESTLNPQLTKMADEIAKSLKIVPL
jgi:hypothetical protein